MRFTSCVVWFSISMAVAANAAGENYLTIVAGDRQVQQRAGNDVPGGTARFAPLSVMVRDASGRPIPGITVAFTCPNHGWAGPVACDMGQAHVGVATTDANGVATLNKRYGNSVWAYYATGPVPITATAPEARPVTFQLSVVDPPPVVVPGATMAIISGDAQSLARAQRWEDGGRITAHFAPLQVIVRDPTGRPIQGAQVTFTCEAPYPACYIDYPDKTSATTYTRADGVATLALLQRNASLVSERDGPLAVTARVGAAAVQFRLNVGTDAAHEAYNSIGPGAETWMRSPAGGGPALDAFQRDVAAAGALQTQGLILILETQREAQSGHQLITAIRLMRLR